MIFVLIGLNVLTRPFLQQDPIIDLKFRETLGFRRNYGSGGDAALVTFDLNVDLTPMWTWNTKQVFLYVFVEYETKKNAVNQVILWDRIIDDREDAYFDESDIRSEYILADQGYHLKGKQVQMRVGWDITPISGPLTVGQSAPITATLPEDYLK